MKTLTRSLVVALGVGATCALALPSMANAQAPGPGAGHEWRMKQFTPQEREAFQKKRIDREAAMLEIKASQEPVWEAYAAAKLDLAKSFGAMMSTGRPDDLDAAALAKKRAATAADIAQKLSAVADATDKLQAALSPEQRKVLDRIARQPAFGHHGFGRFGHGPMGCEGMPGGPGRGQFPPAAPKAPAAKAK